WYSSMLRPPPGSTLFPYTTLFRSYADGAQRPQVGPVVDAVRRQVVPASVPGEEGDTPAGDLTDEEGVAGCPVGGVDLDLGHVVEERVETRAADHADVCGHGRRGRRLGSVHLVRHAPHPNGPPARRTGPAAPGTARRTGRKAARGPRPEARSPQQSENRPGAERRTPRRHRTTGCTGGAVRRLTRRSCSPSCRSPTTPTTSSNPSRTSRRTTTKTKKNRRRRTTTKTKKNRRRRTRRSRRTTSTPASCSTRSRGCHCGRSRSP